VNTQLFTEQIFYGGTRLDIYTETLSQQLKEDWYQFGVYLQEEMST
jgi:hypothetical protein